jgi:flagellar biosynthesis protein FlhF
MIDTPSAAYLDHTSMQITAACLAVARVDETHVVVPLATSVREAESVIRHFQPLHVNRLAVTKLDESRYAGQLLNFGFRFGLPITFLSDGPQIPEDLRAASAREIAELIVPPHTRSPES